MLVMDRSSWQTATGLLKHVQHCDKSRETAPACTLHDVNVVSGSGLITTNYSNEG